MYFSKFPQGNYDLKGDGNFKLVTDIIRRVKVRSKIIDEASLYDKYDVPSGEKPELHWVILMTDNITDRYYDWPLSLQDFETFITDKYTNPDGIHHYEVTRSSGKTSGNGPDDYSHKIEVNSDASGAQSVSNREFEQRLQDQKRLIKLLNPSFLGLFITEFEKLISK